MASSISKALEQKKYWVLLSVGIGTFMSALDGSVVNIILPVLRQHFNSDIATIEWAVVVYLLVLSGFLLTFGRLGDLYGHKRVYLAGYLLFVSSSVLCGISTTALWLVVFRTFQALGAAMLAANGPAILTKAFPPSQRGQALGMQGTMTYLGLVVGPSLGGWLTEQFTWRAVFNINVPVGLLAFLLGLRFIPNDSDEKKQKRHFDWPGAFAFSSGLVALLFALNQGHALGWDSPWIISLVVISFVILYGFVVMQNRAEQPMLDLSLFRVRNFWAATLSAVMNYICLYSIIFLLPFYLIQGRGISPSQSGLLLTTQPLVMMVVAPFSGWISDRIGTRFPSILGLFLVAVAMAMLSQIGAETPLSYLALSLGFAGLGTGLFVSPNSSALMGSAPPERQGIASGVMATARSLGMVLGVGIAGAILTTYTTESHSTQSFFDAINAGFIVGLVPALVGFLVVFIRNNEYSRPRG